MNKVLTIIIPTYNMEDYLRKCLESLIVSDENMERLEVLVINDGSKDFSSQIGHEYESRYPQTFRVIDKENGNYGSCINRGLKEASGKYVKVLDADDYFSKEFDSYISILSIVDADLIITDFMLVDSSGSTVCNVVCRLESNISTCFKDVYMSEYLLNIEMHAMTYLREILIKMNYHQTEGISYTDQEWSFFPMTEVERIHYCPINLYRYYVGRPGQTIDISMYYKNIAQNFSILKSTIDFYYHKSEKICSWKRIYLYNRICNRIDKMYKKYIIDRSSLSSDILEFATFQVLLKENYHQLYIDAADYCILDKKIPFHYLKYWRHNNHSILLNFMINLYSFLVFLRKQKNSIRKTIHYKQAQKK